MSIIDVVKWDGAPNVFAFKFPNSELNTKTQLIVRESQEVFFQKEGLFYGPLGPGRHVLDTKNYPFLTALVSKMISGGVSPFTTEVWFVQKAIPLDLKWGTSIPLQIEDPQYHVMLPVRAFGQYGLQVDNAKKFLVKIVGQVPNFTTEILRSYFRGIIITHVKDCISSYLIDKGISILHIGSKMREISEYINGMISNEMKDFGLRSFLFNVNAITTDDKDPAVMQLKSALAKKAEMDIIGYTYQQERSFDTMQTAAGNAGTGGNMIGAGLGLGMGFAAGGPMGNIMGNMAQNLNTNQMRTCSRCGVPVSADMKFCPECGSPMQSASSGEKIKCSQCGGVFAAGTKFCPECGVNLQCFCQSCGAKLNGILKFCPECGAKQEHEKEN